VEVRAVRQFALLLWALQCPKNLWMKYILIPTMGLVTLEAFIATTLAAVLYDRRILFPFFATLRLVEVKFVLAPEVLKVVSVHATISLVSFLIKRTPYCLEMEHIEVLV
jgi:hypothetical protein